jgi:TP901 family phage tail tape measure protein
MADLTKIVSILFEADDQMSASLSTISSSFDSFESKISSIASPLSDIADKIIKLDTALAAMAVGGAAYAIGKFSEFEDKMLTVKGIMQASDSDYERLTELTKGLGETTRYTAEQAAEGLQYLAMSGMKTNDAIGALPETLKLAQAANVSLGEAANIVVNIMAGYGKQVSELPSVNDTLVATFTNTNTNLTQLYDGFKMVGPLAKAMGVDIQDLSAVLGALANAGYQGEMGGTALRNILVALAEPTKDMSKVMEKLGVDTSAMGVELGSGQKAMESLGVKVKDANGNMRPLVDIIADLQKGIQNIHDPVDQAGILMEIFGKRGGPQMAALLTQGGDAIRALEEKIKSAGGITSSIADIMESRMGGAIRALKSAIEAAVINIGDELKKGVEPATEGMTALFRAIASAVKTGSFDDVFQVVQNMGVDLEEALKTIAQNLPEALEKVDFSGFLDALGEFGDTIKGFFQDDIDLTTVEGLANALQGVVDFLTGLVRVTNGMAESIGPVFKTIVEGVQSVATADKEQSGTLGNILGASKLIVELGGSVVAALALIEQSGTSVQSVYDVLAGSIKTAWNTLQVGFDSIVLLIAESVTAILDSVNTLTFGSFSNEIQQARDSVERFRSAVATDFTAQMQDLGDGLDQIGRGFTGAGDSAAEAADKIGDVSEAMADVPEKIDTGVDVFLTGEEKVDSWLMSMHNIDAITVSTFLEVDESKSQAAKKELEDVLRYEDGIPVYAVTYVDKNAAEKTKKELAEAIPESKQMEIKLKGEIDKEITKIKADADTVQTAMEWNAKLNIAQAEAEASKLESMMQNTSDIITGMGETISSLFSATPKDSSSWMEWYDALKQQEKIQQETHDLNKEILKQQIKMMELKNQKLKSGDAMIKIDATSLAAPLKTLFWELVNMVHIEADQMGQEYLLGI